MKTDVDGSESRLLIDRIPWERLSSERIFRFLLGSKILRRKMIEIIEQRAYHELVEVNADNRPRRVQEVKVLYMRALLHGLNRAIDKGYVTRRIVGRLLDTFLHNVILHRNDQEAEAAKRLGFIPPLFITISPTGQCNLQCTGCYAASEPELQGKLDFPTFDRILTEKEQLWHSYFTVISGGEPFLWRDGDWDFLDVVEKHSNNLFMVYTNATCITEGTAKRMADLGNITPAISVEGFEEETDARRGKGVFRKVMTAMEHLRKHGVPFGVSGTPTRYNWQVIVSDRFVDFYFDEQGAVYAWLFQYMPIGRGQTLDLMVSPADRIEMFRRMEHFVRDRNAFMADFWNSGPSTSGCISGGRAGGYFYIDWNGNVTPCVFIPYAVANIREVFARGETINSLLQTPLMKKIRAWQDEHGYARCPEEVQNWLCPCVAREHFDFLKRALLETSAQPINREAEEALHDEDYERRMIEYGKIMHEATASFWEERFAEKPGNRLAAS